MSKTSNRPLSPHLQVYKPQLTSTLSILHRATGIALSVGSLAVVYWLTALAAGPEAFANANGFLGSFIGQLIILGWIWALSYHLCNGIRHLAWDYGYGFDLKTTYMTGRIVIIASVVLTFFIWLISRLGG